MIYMNVAECKNYAGSNSFHFQRIAYTSPTDDQALIVNASTDLQAMLEIIFSESAATRARSCPCRQWLIGTEVIPERL